MKIFVSIILFLNCCTLYSQNNNCYSKEFAFKTENDLYALQYKDGYYSNGLFFALSKAYNTSNYKKIKTIEIGQSIYTNHDRREFLRGNEPIDRPYCGLLYAKLAVNNFFKNNKFLGYSIMIGATGSWSFAGQLQKLYHQKVGLFDYFQYPFWDIQIQNSIAANVGIQYAKSFYDNTKQKKAIKFVPIIEANAGLFYNNIKLGSFFCFGKMENLNNSNLLNAGINANKRLSKKYKHELYCFINPQIQIQLYNATVQGTMFYKQGPQVFTSTPTPLFFVQKVGVAYSNKKVSTKFFVAFETKEAKSQLTNNFYGSLQIGYKFN